MDLNQKLEAIYEDVVRWIANRQRIDLDAVRDAVHEVTTRLRTGIRNLRNYLTRAAVLQHRSPRKKKRPKCFSELTRKEMAQVVATHAHGPRPDEVAQVHDESAIAKDEIAQMPPREREVMRLYFGGLKAKEIAAALGISASTVRSTYRHVEKLRKKFGVARIPPRKTRTCRRRTWPKNAKSSSSGPSTTRPGGSESRPPHSAAG